MFKQLSILKTITSYSQKFVNDNTKRLTKKIFDNNIKNQYSTTKTMITNFVENFLKSDAAINKKFIIFQQKKQHSTYEFQLNILLRRRLSNTFQRKKNRFDFRKTKKKQKTKKKNDECAHEN